MTKASVPIEEVNSLLFDDETQEFNSNKHTGDTGQQETQKTEPRLLKQKELSTDFEQLEAVPYYKRPLVQVAAVLVVAIPVGWLLISAFSPGEPISPQIQSANRPENIQNQLLQKSLDQERKKNQDLSIQNGMKNQRLEVIPVAQSPKPEPKVVNRPAPVTAPPVQYVLPRRSVAYYNPPIQYFRPVPQVVKSQLDDTPLRHSKSSTTVVTTPPPPTLEQQQQKLLALSSVGIFGSNTVANDTSTVDSQATTTSTRVSEKPLRDDISSSRKTSYETQTFQQSQLSYQPAYSDNPSAQLPLGTHAKGELERAIAWDSSLQNISQQNYRIKLLEPLKSINGSVVIPQDSYLVARINNATNSGLLEMSVISVQMVENGQLIEKPLPQSAISGKAILVLGESGNTLQSKFHTHSHSGNGLAMPFLAGASQVAGLINQPNSQSIFSSGGGFQSTTTNRQPNYAAGFVGGASQALVQQMQNRNAMQSTETQAPSFSLPQRYRVQIYVNQPLILSLNSL